MDTDHPLTIPQAAKQLGVSEKTLRRRLAKPDLGGLDAIKVHTRQGYEWRLSLSSRLDTDRVDSPPPDHPESRVDVSTVQAPFDRPAPRTSEAELGVRVVDTLREVIIEQQRRLEAAAEERGKLRAEVEYLRQQRSNAQQPLQRPWWAFWRGRGA